MWVNIPVPWMFWESKSTIYVYLCHIYLAFTINSQYKRATAPPPFAGYPRKKTPAWATMTWHFCQSWRTKFYRMQGGLRPQCICARHLQQSGEVCVDGILPKKWTICHTAS